MKTITPRFLIILFLLIGVYSYAQNVGIGSTTFTPDPSAVLELKSTNQGLLPPRMTTAEREAIVNPATGLIIFNITTNCLNYRVGNNWYDVCGECTPPIPGIPTAATHQVSQTEIVWNWNIVTGATGYKYNTANDIATATDNGTNTSYIQEGLTCGIEYILYVWAYNECGISLVGQLVQSTSLCPFTCGISTITDERDNNVYNTVQIGNQCWLRDNMKYLPTVNSNANANKSASSPRYYIFTYTGTDVQAAKNTVQNSENMYNVYGVLYNWPAAMNSAASSTSNPSGVQGICPTGWHLPSVAEWNEMTTFLGTNPGTKLKSIAGWYNNGNGTNTSNFTAKPGGYVVFEGINAGSWQNLAWEATFWTTTQFDSNCAYGRRLRHDSQAVNELFTTSGYSGPYKANGHFVRCVKN